MIKYVTSNEILSNECEFVITFDLNVHVIRER